MNKKDKVVRKKHKRSVERVKAKVRASKAAAKTTRRAPARAKKPAGTAAPATEA